MTGHQPVPLHGLAALVAVVAVFALVLQYVLLIGHVPASGSVLFLTVRFFSYFTILSNLLVLLVTASAAFVVDSARGRCSQGRWCAAAWRCTSA